MPQIVGFSPRVYEAARQFFAARPVYSMRQTREIEVESQLVRVTAVRCLACGETLPLPETPMPSDALAAVEFTHEWKLDRSGRCGGAIKVSTEPVLGLVEIPR